MNLKSAPATILLGSAGLLLLAALGWVALLGPALGDLGATDASRIEAQDRNQAMRLELARLRQQAESLPETDAMADRLDDVFPPTADQPGFFAQVSAVTENAGIPAGDVAVLSPGVPEVPVAPGAPPADAAPAEGTAAPEDAPVAVSAGTVAEQVVTVEVRGSYEELTRVLEGVEEMERGFLVTTANFAASEDGVLTLTLVGRTFVAPPLAPAPS
jgi:Tfp pilus assembly protein PilO